MTNVRKQRITHTKQATNRFDYRSWCWFPWYYVLVPGMVMHVILILYIISSINRCNGDTEINEGALEGRRYETYQRSQA